MKGLDARPMNWLQFLAISWAPRRETYVKVNRNGRKEGVIQCLRDRWKEWIWVVTTTRKWLSAIIRVEDDDDGKIKQSSLNFPILPYRRNQKLVQVPCSLVLQGMNCSLSATGTRCPKLCCACTWRDRLLRHRVMWGLKDKHSFSRYDVSSNLSQFCVGALSKSLYCAPRWDTVLSFCVSFPGDVTVYQLTVS